MTGIYFLPTIQKKVATTPTYNLPFFFLYVIFISNKFSTFNKNP